MCIPSPSNDLKRRKPHDRPHRLHLWQRPADAGGKDLSCLGQLSMANMFLQGSNLFHVDQVNPNSQVKAPFLMRTREGLNSSEQPLADFIPRRQIWHLCKV